MDRVKPVAVILVNYFIHTKTYVLMYSLKKKTLSMGKPEHETNNMLMIELYLISPGSFGGIT